MIRDAVLSDCGRYRYRLSRRWDSGLTVAWVMLNPSTADAEVDDPTIRRCIGFARAWGFGALEVVNLYAWRATDPAELGHVDDPVGPRNAEHVGEALGSSLRTVAAWGAGITKAKAAPLPVAHLARRRGIELACLGTTKAGHPRHPLYVPTSQPLEHYAEGSTPA